MKSVPSENIVKLRKLTEKLSTESFDAEYKKLIIQLKKIVDEGKSKIESTDSTQNKIKCYESMCSSITGLLSNVNI